MIKLKSLLSQIILNEFVINLGDESTFNSKVKIGFSEGMFIDKVERDYIILHLEEFKEYFETRLRKEYDLSLKGDVKSELKFLLTGEKDAVYLKDLKEPKPSFEDILEFFYRYFPERYKI
jgi:hypothetical protein